MGGSGLGRRSVWGVEVLVVVACKLVENGNNVNLPRAEELLD
jgi:hypothetical protein